uniref:Putative LOC100572414 [Acyrthosiphon pisum] n=1 Tax=Lepeophtheirus salmonis TaxID=72036 RepID=A0A0K2UC27_LEPSM
MIEKFEGAATCWDVPSSGRPRTALSKTLLANTLPSTANVIAPW